MSIGFTRWRLHHMAVVLVALSLVLPATTELAAQEYRGFEYDSTLHLGAHIIPSARLAKDSLLLDFGQYYGMDIDHAKYVLGQSDTAWMHCIQDRKIYAFDYGGAHGYDHSLYWQCLFDSLQKGLILEADAIGFGMIYNPLRISDLADNALAAEHYVPFRRNYGELGYQVIDFSHWYNNQDGAAIDTLAKDSLQWVVSVPQTSDGSRNDALVAGEPKRTHEPALSGFHQALTQRLTEVGVSDSSDYHRISFVIKAGDTINSTDYPSTTQIGYVLLYQRDRHSQNDCKCNVFTPLGPLPDTLWITKDMYQHAIVDTIENTGGYREIGWTFNNVLERRSVGNYFHRRRVLGSTTVLDSTWNTDVIPSSVWDTAVVYFTRSPTHYRIDTLRVPGSSPPDTTFTEYYGDSLHFLAVPVIGLTPNEFAPPDTSAAHIDSCAARFARQVWGSRALNFPDRGVTTQSEFDYRFYSTRIVPMKFLRSRISSYMYEALKAGRLDTLVKKDLGDIFANDTLAPLRSATLRLGFDDEMQHSSFPADRLLSQKMQDVMWDRYNAGRKPLFTNPLANMDGVRILTGDITTRQVKVIPLLTRQSYFEIGSGPLPIAYANPDSMETLAKQKFYRASDIVINSDSAYAAYTRNTQEFVAWNGEHWGFGRFRDYTTGVSALNGPLVPQLVRAVDVSRFKYAHLGASNPVWTVIQTMGKNYVDSNGTGFSGAYKANGFEFRIPTPEEILAQTWLSFNCGATGFVFGDIAWDGFNLGIIEPRTMEHSAEYAALSVPNGVTDTLPLTYPKMWVGLGSRFGAVKEVAAQLRAIDTAVGFRNLIYAKEQMSLFDTVQYFSDMPLLDTLYTRKAQRDARDGGGGFLDSTGSGSIDPRSETYLEVTHFRPGPRLADERAKGVRYFLLTNRRTWPIDEKNYSSATVSTYGGSGHGLGAIDVRRPIIVLKSAQEMLADSFVVQKVLDTAWHQGVRGGTALSLDWLKPGRGELYRVTPIRRGISPLGIAYNNATRSASITDTARKGQVVVYERDSIIYAMTMSATGAWSKEFRISDSIDATPAGRIAYNMFPAVAPARTGTSWLYLWERYTISTGKTSVEARYFPRFPNPDSLNTSIRITALAPARTISGGYHMTPAVVGTDSGFVAAWATPMTGIESVAIPVERTPFKAAYVSPVQVSRGALSFFGIPDPDSLCQYPTLAYVPNYNGVGHVVHLAWQQAYNFHANSRIFYQQLQVRHGSAGQAALTALKAPEDVNLLMGGCTYINPSIAADSVRVGVAFQSVWPTYKGKSPAPPGGVSVITLRFRDSTALAAGWRTPAYYWGDDSSWYERPTIVEFPRAPRSALTGTGGHPEGALSWFRLNGDSVSAGTNQIYFYRFGKASVNRVREGEHPSLTQVPFRSTAPYMTQSSLLYRDATSARFQAATYYSGTNANYLGGLLLNHPAQPDTNFTSVAGDSIRLFSIKSLRTVMTGKMPTGIFCSATFAAGITVVPTSALAPNYPVAYPDSGITPGPEVPPSVWAPPSNGGTFVETLDDAANISRTSVFTAGMSGVTIKRALYGSDDLLDWLATQPYDSSAGMAADVRTWLELVRDNDGAVLWRGDTVMARTAGDSTIETSVVVPVGTAAAPGTNVYVRLRLKPTAGIADTSYDVSAGVYNEIDPSDPGYLKMVRPGTEHAVTGESAAPHLAILPNPARSTAEVRVTTLEEGAVELTVFDVMGNPVSTFPPAGIRQPGEYVVSIDVSGMANGIYTVRARLGGRQATGQLTVQR